jgi:cytochrome b subunit of formate dehydrogenase
MTMRASKHAQATHAIVSQLHLRTLVLAAWLLCTSAAALAADPDNCLLCHQFRGLSRFDADADRVRIFFVDPDYHRHLEGPHARLRCVDCHPRDEVAIIPHAPVSKVNCTQACHLESETGPARRFSHDNIAHMLADSVHDPQQLADLTFDRGPLLAAGQSQCLYCHDEPVFRDLTPLITAANLSPARSFDRCDVCHLEQVPMDVRYYLRHVGSRLRPTRPPLEQAQICAVCHNDPEVLAKHELSNAVASFVRSFHGKAALLGSPNTADCLACHVRSGENAHMMLAKTDPRSSVHPDNVADSCRSVQCHPGADVRIATIGVHLDLPTAWGSLEFGIAVAFIVLTAVSFGPSLVICLMELLQIVIGRHHHSGARIHQLLDRVLQHPDGRARLKRFTVSQRWQHWLLAALFILLALTGFPMKFASDQWARTMIDMFGGLHTARLIHHWSGIALVIGFIAHAFYALATMLANARTTTADGGRKGVFRAIWDMPMLIRPGDLLKANLLMLYLFGLRRDPPTFGRFSIKEKFEYIGVAWGTTLLGVTGIMLWGEQFFSHYLGGRVFNIALIAHTYEAFLAIIHVGILHIANVTVSPNVFPLSRATITGDTPAEELVEQHSDFVEDAARELGVDKEA